MFNVYDYVVIKKIVFRGSRTLEVAWWPNGSRRLRRSHRTLMRWFWNMWETLASPKKREFKCEFELRSTHSRPCCGSPWTKRLASTWCWPEEGDGPKNLGLVHPSPWERKVEGNNCKKPFILPFGDGNEMFLSVNWFATVTRIWFWFEPGTWRLRNWKLKHRRTAQGFETSGHVWCGEHTGTTNCERWIPRLETSFPVWEKAQHESSFRQSLMQVMFQYFYTIGQSKEDRLGCGRWWSTNVVTGQGTEKPEGCQNKTLSWWIRIGLNDVIVSEITVALAGENFTCLPMKQCSEKCCQKIW